MLYDIRNVKRSRSTCWQLRKVPGGPQYNCKQSFPKQKESIKATE